MNAQIQMVRVCDCRREAAWGWVPATSIIRMVLVCDIADGSPAAARTRGNNVWEATLKRPSVMAGPPGFVVEVKLVHPADVRRVFGDLEALEEADHQTAEEGDCL